jgi:asparagine synthase (glutamine-hydrolysing)
MCGIAGIISAQPGFVTRSRLQNMSNTIAHRGPDGEGFYISEKQSSTTGLAHRRLAVIDLSDAAGQPLHYMDRYIIIHNGELYNYGEIKSRLANKGLTFKTNSDTEVIAAAYHFYREDCLDEFDGMFAFAIWDQQEDTLFCARDRFGEKPFYYSFHEEHNTLYFASEMKAIWAAGVPRKIKPQLFLHFLSLGITQHPQLPELSFYEDIFQLPPAHKLTYTTVNHTLNITRYWDLDKETVIDISESEAIATFKRLFENAIQKRLNSDVAIGTSLSGGLDSSCIVAACSSQGKSAFTHNSFSAIFPGFDKDESDFIRLMKERYSLDTHFTSPDSVGLIRNMHELASHQEEPFTSSSVYAQYAVYALAKEKNIKVLLDGQGADEILGGYTKYTHWYLQECLAKRQIRLAKQESVALQENGFLEKWGIRNYVAAYFPGITANRLERKSATILATDPYIDQRFRDAHSGGGFIFKPVVEKLNDILYYDTCMGGLQALLRYADRNAMAHGREVRMPFLQHELVSFVFSLPSGLKIKNGFTKWILRQSYRSHIPENIHSRKGKTGFEPPQKSWMEDKTVQQQIHQARQKLVDAGMLNPSVLKKPVTPQPAYATGNEDWRHWNASLFL